jgi:hypothetical protein
LGSDRERFPKLVSGQSDEWQSDEDEGCPNTQALALRAELKEPPHTESQQCGR